MTSFQTYQDYTPPSWSARPTITVYFELLKNGVTLLQIPLDQKAMYLVGKNADICDIILENPTISRKHAVIQNKNNNECYIYDLGSQNGTFVNNRQIATKLFHKLSIYDQVRFGGSDRIYIFRCPDQEKDDSAQQEQKIIDKQNRKKAKQEFKSLKDQYLNMLMKDPEYSYMKPKNQGKKAQNEDEGVSWGMIDEEEIYRYQQEQEYPLEAEILKQLPGLNENQLEKIKQYDEKYMKFRAVQDELDELINKERQNYGLEESLKRKKEKLQNKQIDLSNELDQADEQLRFILFGDKNHQKKFTQQKDANSSEEDEYYDNTLSKVQKKIKIEKDQVLENTTANYNVLKNQLDELIKEKTNIAQQILNLHNHITQHQSQEEDELDKFMHNTYQDLAKESEPILKLRLGEIQKQIDSILIQIQTVRPGSDVRTDFKDLFSDEKPQEIKQSEIETFKKPTSSISSTLNRLKQISKKISQEDEENEDQILENANKYFSVLTQKEKLELQKIENEKKRQERKRLIELTDQEELQQDQKNIRQYGATYQPHSRHYRENEIEKNEDFIDLIQFH